MADVDTCSRYAEAGLCDDPKTNAIKISEISDDLRNIIFRGKDAARIEKMLRKYSETIKNSISKKYNFECAKLSASSDNNRDSADLFCLLPNGQRLIIEVKFGAYTDKAAGMQNFANIFGTTAFTDALSLEQRKEWEKMITIEYPEMGKQATRSANALNRAVEKFNQHMASLGFVLPKKNQEFMEDYLLNNSGSFESHSDCYMRFETSKDGSKIVPVASLKKGVGQWRVPNVNQIDINDDKSRVNVFAINEESKIKIKFVLNNKNDLKLKNIPGAKVRSKYMVNSPSWNVWIYQL